MKLEPLEARRLLSAPPSIPGDADLNGHVNLDDFNLFLNGYQNGLGGFENGDFDLNGSINLDDFNEFLFAYQNPKPGEHNTGLLHDDLAVLDSGLTVEDDGAVIENLEINGTLNIKANDVTVRNVRINATSFYGVRAIYGFTNLTLEHVEISGASSAGIYGENFVARRLNIHSTGSDGIKPRRNATVLDSWVHDLGTSSGAHADGVQILSGSNFVFRGNFFDQPKGVPGHATNATFMIQSNNAPIDNILIENNWLSGGNFCIQVLEVNYPTTNVTIRNNRFIRLYDAEGDVYSPKYGTHRFNVPVEWSGNVWDDTGETIPLDD